jgi:pSer/pThr/pTyr-binding forkhead associated (FHA) protein
LANLKRGGGPDPARQAGQYLACYVNHQKGTHMPTITINPDGAKAQVITLKEGENTVGRADDNDICITEGGVSSHHCKIIVNGPNVTLVDLNSTNGTAVNGARITEAAWNEGDLVYLGNLPVRLGDAIPMAVPLAEAVAVAAVAPAAPTAVAAKGPIRLRISKSQEEPSSSPAAEPEVVASSLPPHMASEIMSAPAGTRCKSHPKSPARWHCPKCRKFFCDLCVSTRASHLGPAHNCRTCGGNCVQVQLEYAASAEDRGFFARLPGAFIYPFLGTGVLVLIFATILFALLGAVSGIFSILLTMAAVGYLFLFMQNIIQATANNEDRMPGMPDFDGLFGAFFTMAGTVLFCFSLPIGLLIATFSGAPIPPSFLIGSMFLSWLYFPMAFLAVAMNDSVMAANPMVVIPAILKVPGQYIVTALLLCGVFGFRLLGDMLASAASDATMTTRDMSVMFLAFGFRAIWAFISLYLLTVGMRIMGILYVTQKHKLGWFRN